MGGGQATPYREAGAETVRHYGGTEYVFGNTGECLGIYPQPAQQRTLSCSKKGKEISTPREVATVEAVDATLKHNAEFTAAYPGARLGCIDSMRGVNEHRHGRYYLRYQHAGGMAEFWGHVAKTPTFDFKKGVVGVPMQDLPHRKRVSAGQTEAGVYF
jgi:hypothetical protein